MDIFKQLAELKAGDALSAELGRAFFSQISDIERKQLLEKMLEEKKFELILAIAYCGHVSASSDRPDRSYKAGINARYFKLFSSVVSECGIEVGRVFPLYFACASSKANSPLAVWRGLSIGRIRELATVPEYSKAVCEFIRKNDCNFVLAPLTVEVFGESALNEYIELAVFGKGINKVALRNFLRSYAAETLDFVKSAYPKMKSSEKVAAVRLLLSVKNADEVEEYLSEVKKTESLKSVLKLFSLPENSGEAYGGEFESSKLKAYFYDMMVSGKQIGTRDFMKNLARPEFSELSDQLFFSLYEGGEFLRLFVTDGGKIFDIYGAEIILPEHGGVKVTHPVELNRESAQVTRWNITQPFVQIRRKVYAPSDADVGKSSYGEIEGITVTAERFTANMRSLGFRVLNYGSGGTFDYVGLKRDGIWCVLFITPMETAHKTEGSVMAQCVRFYDDKDIIRLGHNLFVDGVTPLALDRIDARAFSEFIYSVYKLMGCE